MILDALGATGTDDIWRRSGTIGREFREANLRELTIVVRNDTGDGIASNLQVGELLQLG